MRSGRSRYLEIDTWFRPVSARPLAGLRVGLPLLLLFHLIWMSNDVLSLHGNRGIIPWELTDLLRDPWVPGLPTLAKAFLPLGIRAHTAIILLLSGYAGSLLSLALGFYPRLSAFLAWGLHLSLITSGFASFYGVDQLANTFLFYLFLFPSGRYTLELIGNGIAVSAVGKGSVSVTGAGTNDDGTVATNGGRPQEVARGSASLVFGWRASATTTTATTTGTTTSP